MQRLKELKVIEWQSQLPIQGNHFVSPGESIPLFGTKSFGLAEPKISGKESTSFASSSLEILMNKTTLISTS